MAFTSYGYSTSAEEPQDTLTPVETNAKTRYQGPLKGFSILVFSVQFPATKEVADKVNTLVKDILPSFGKV